MKEIKVQWHPGFVAAMDLELSANRGDLVYEKEYNLNTKPLEIDLLVIKKESHVQISNEIGRIFRGHNIMEYKSPDDHLDVDTFYKAGAYASLYKSYGKTVDERKAEDITVSMVREVRPRGLFKYLKEHGIEIGNPYHGIYYVLDGVLFPTQIIVTGELDGQNHTWLKALSDKLKKEEMKNLLDRIDALTGSFERGLADAVLEVSVRANQEIAEELKGDEHMCQALLEIMEPEINKIAEEAAKEAAKETAIRMVKAGKLSVDEIKEFFPKLSAEQIKQIGKEFNIL